MKPAKLQKIKKLIQSQPGRQFPRPYPGPPPPSQTRPSVPGRPPAQRPRPQFPRPFPNPGPKKPPYA